MRPTWDIRETAWPADPAAAAGVYADDAELAWLDGTGDLATRARGAALSLFCSRPCLRVEQFDGRPAALLAGRRLLSRSPNGWALWRAAASRLPRLPLVEWGVCPGWIGYVGFEMARFLERLPRSHREELGLPLLRLALFDRGIVLDYRRRRAFAVRAHGLGGDRLAGSDADHDPDWLQRWDAATTTVGRASIFEPPHIRLEIGRRAHEAAVRRALEYIAAGDIYQVNLAHRFRVDGVGDPLGLYAAVRQTNPAPYAALLRWDGGAVASFSPELFLRVRGSRVLTRPIKGTRPRTGKHALDEPQRRELLASEKERAELTMIVDLHRNDLGRVCAYGSVRVPHPRRLEAHPTVYHTVADVVGRLAPDRDALDLLAACFPAGSVTGVPKIRAMQIIDELEPATRGVYTGAIGLLGLDGQMTFNVAIRTLQIRGSAATLYVGGGIVADSDPAAEYEETLAKARGILRGLKAGDRPAADAGRLIAATGHR